MSKNKKSPHPKIQQQNLVQDYYKRTFQQDSNYNTRRINPSHHTLAPISQVTPNNSQAKQPAASVLQIVRHSLIDACYGQGIQEFYVRTFLKAVSSIQEAEQCLFLDAELLAIREGTSAYHRISKIVTARYNCVQRIRRNIDKYSGEFESYLSAALQKVCAILSHLRLLTLTLVESVAEWKKDIISMYRHSRNRDPRNPLSVIFCVDGIDVLELVGRDCLFLNATPLRKYVPFSKVEDPLFLFPLKQLQNPNQQMKRQEAVLRIFSIKPTEKARLYQAACLLKSYSQVAQDLRLQADEILREETINSRSKSSKPKRIRTEGSEFQRKESALQQLRHRRAIKNLLSAKVTQLPPLRQERSQNSMYKDAEVNTIVQVALKQEDILKLPIENQDISLPRKSNHFFPTSNSFKEEMSLQAARNTRIINKDESQDEAATLTLPSRRTLMHIRNVRYSHGYYRDPQPAQKMVAKTIIEGVVDSGSILKKSRIRRPTALSIHEYGQQPLKNMQTIQNIEVAKIENYSYIEPALQSGSIYMHPQPSYQLPSQTMYINQPSNIPPQRDTSHQVAEPVQQDPSQSLPENQNVQAVDNNIPEPPPPPPEIETKCSVAMRMMKMSECELFFRDWMRPYVTPEEYSLLQCSLLTTKDNFKSYYTNLLKENGVQAAIATCFVLKNSSIRTLIVNNLVFLISEVLNRKKLIISYVKYLFMTDPCKRVAFVFLKNNIENRGLIQPILLSNGFIEAPYHDSYNDLFQDKMYIMDRKTESTKQVEQVSLLDLNLSCIVVSYLSDSSKLFQEEGASKPLKQNYLQRFLLKDAVVAFAYHQKIRKGEELKEIRNSAQPKSRTSLSVKLCRDLQQVNNILSKQSYECTRKIVQGILLGEAQMQVDLVADYICNGKLLYTRSDNQKVIYGSSKDFKYVLLAIDQAGCRMYLAFWIQQAKSTIFSSPTLAESLATLAEEISYEQKWVPGKAIKIRMFKKRFSGWLRDVDSRMSVFQKAKISFNYVNYMNSHKIYDLEEETVDFVGNMYVGLLFQEQGYYIPWLAAEITEQDLL